MGFAADSGVMSDLMPGLSIELDNVKLSASCVAGKRFHPVVLLTGWYRDSRRTGEISDKLPRQLKSREQGMAWLVWILDRAAGGKFEPKSAPDWLARGLKHFDLLPWKRTSSDK